MWCQGGIICLEHAVALAIALLIYYLTDRHGQHKTK